MTTINELLRLQQETGESIQQIIRNYKKDSADRKTTPAYFQQRLQSLTALWDQFGKTDGELRILVTEPTNFEYFKNEYYNKIQSLALEYLEIFQTKADLLKNQQPQASANTLSSTTPKLSTSLKGSSSSTENFSPNGLIRKITARMSALRRFLSGLSSVEETNSPQFYKFQIDTVNRLWSHLYDQSWDQMTNPLAVGLNQDEYDSLNDLVHTIMQRLHRMSDHQIPNSFNRSSPVPVSSLPLPKITIPKFDGDYGKWRQFYDLFSQMVDRQQIPAVQKMWYLKANLSGEAEKLISHFSTTETNYSSAWKMLQERYNNKRILVANLVEKILSQPTATSNGSSIKALHDTTHECLLALENIGVKTESWGPLLLQILIKKLDRNMHMRFEQSLEQPRDLPTMNNFLSFLEFQFQTMDAIGHKEKQKSTHNSTNAVSSAATSDKQHGSCKFCHTADHALYYCNKFLQLSEADRLKYVQSQKLCVNCFKHNHSAKNCSWGPCKKCNKKHNTLLHLGSNYNQHKSPQPGNQLQKPQHSNIQPNTDVAANTTNVTVTSAAANKTPSRQGYVLLATARVKITAANGNSGEFRAILDSSSQVNLVSERVVKKLSIATSDASLCIDGIGNAQRRATRCINVKLQGRSNNFAINLEAFVLPTIIPSQPNKHIDVSNWQIPNVDLADPYFYQPGRVDILLGAEYYFSLMQNGKIVLADDLPILLNTSLGWIVSGRAALNQDLADAATCAISTTNEGLSDHELLNDVIERLWKMDDDGPCEKGFSQDEQQCEAHFAQNIKTDSEGRFIINLPFRENTSALGESEKMAYNRFISLERRLLKDSHTRAICTSISWKNI